MRRLLLLRHAKAEPAGHGPDFDRALAERGRKNARALGAFLEKKGLAPAYACVSPARRTMETWECIADALSAACRPAIDPQLYGASERTLLAAVHAVAARHKSAMLLGHNPGLARLALILAGSGEERELQAMHEKFPTCALAVLDFDIADWRRVLPEGGTLKCFMTPASLGET
jgi:phosphohistidine phosphatase